MCQLYLRLRTLGADALVVGCDDSSSRKNDPGPTFVISPAGFGISMKWKKIHKDFGQRGSRARRRTRYRPSSKYYEMILGGRTRFSSFRRKTRYAHKKFYDHMLDSKQKLPSFSEQTSFARIQGLNGCERAVIGQLLWRSAFEFEPLQKTELPHFRTERTNGTASSSGSRHQVPLRHADSYPEGIVRV